MLHKSSNEKVRVLCYLIIGGTAALFEWSLVYLFNLRWGWNYLVATAAAYLCSTVCHYIATNIWVFTSGVRYSRKKEFSLVLVVSTLGLLLNVLLMRIFVGGMGLPVMVSKIIASALVTIWNYFSRKKWIYVE
ncbi:MAG: GtrA family protein [Acidaminococcus sp.]|uniref:GtrA family protein n=1 Tax=Acidaminococcus TaxID=904 RepID=UPI00248BE92F|nr:MULTISPECIES: GtrA family protein [Acidaminococcus]MDO5597336.1 GtrA family protein [Acidaminococcus sp.]